jgi:hypothetical protein
MPGAPKDWRVRRERAAEFKSALQVRMLDTFTQG